MEELRERFLKTYANVPLSMRDDIVATLDDHDKPISWDVAYLEVRANTGVADQILKKLAELEMI